MLGLLAPCVPWLRAEGGRFDGLDGGGGGADGEGVASGPQRRSFGERRAARRAWSLRASELLERSALLTGVPGDGAADADAELAEEGEPQPLGGGEALLDEALDAVVSEVLDASCGAQQPAGRSTAEQALCLALAVCDGCTCARAAGVSRAARDAADDALQLRFRLHFGLGRLEVDARPRSTRFWVASRPAAALVWPYAPAEGESWHAAALAYGTSADAVASASRLSTHERTLRRPRDVLLVPPRHTEQVAGASARVVHDVESGRVVAMLRSWTNAAGQGVGKAAMEARALSARRAVSAAAAMQRELAVGAACVGEYYAREANFEIKLALSQLAEDAGWDERFSSENACSTCIAATSARS